ncbi:MAG: hypothetical protein QOE74_5209 [Mycobacterium sp.]|nr:hypothetical protein [Mycobacterium sp.]MDT5316189.1 hypothetical protein [Mycobacterium sp.]
MDSQPNGRGDRFDGPVTVDLLADLQAGLLDDQGAARLRQRARTEPDIAGQLSALERVRRDVADLGSDAASAPDIPADITARIGAALRSARAPSSRLRRAAAVTGVAAVVAAGAVGTTMLVRSRSGGIFGTSPAASSSEASRPRDGIPLADDEVIALLSRPPDLGALTDPLRRVSCLSGLGYPTSTSVLGARPLDVSGRPGVLVLLPGDAPRRINAVVVAPNCSAVDTGLLASRVVDRP